MPEPDRTSRRPLHVRAIDAAVRAYSHVAPTGRGGYRLTRLARRIHSANDQVARFQTPDGLRFDLDLRTYPCCVRATPSSTAVRKIGYFTCLAAKRVGPSGRVHAFEPQPDHRRRLVEHVAMNGLEDVVVIQPVALSDRAGEVELHTSENPASNHGQSTVFAGAQTSRKVTVNTVRLDDDLPGITPRLIKLDIEGAEPLAIAGMRDPLRRNRPAVIIERNATTMGRAGFLPREPLDELLAAVPRYESFVIGWRLKRAHDVERLGEVNLLLR